MIPKKMSSLERAKLYPGKKPYKIPYCKSFQIKSTKVATAITQGPVLPLEQDHRYKSLKFCLKYYTVEPRFKRLVRHRGFVS